MQANALNDRIVIVTGASRGIGRAIAIKLAEHGAVVVAVSRSLQTQDDPYVSPTEQVIEAGGGRVMTGSADVRDETQVAAMTQRVLDTYGRIDTLVNNAGIMVGDVAFRDTAPSMWREIMDTNLTGAYLCCRAVVPSMMARGRGVIVNITSGAAVRTGFLNVPYGVSKAGLDRLTLGLSAELKSHGIACVSLSPPVSATETVRRMYPDRDVECWAKPPELTAEAVCRLLKEDPMRFTGQVVSVSEYLEEPRPSYPLP